MTVITGPILDSAAQPANGYLYGRQSARMEIGGALVTQTVVRVIVKDGTPYLPDGVTPFSATPTIDGEYFEIVEDLRNFDGQIVRKVTIPEAGPVSYGELIDVVVPVSSSMAIVPGWYRSLAESAGGIEASIELVQGIRDQTLAARDDAQIAADRVPLDIATAIESADIPGAASSAVADAIADTQIITDDTPGYDGFLFIGQSNVPGRGEGATDRNLNPIDSRIMQFAAAGTYAGVISQASDPLAHPELGAKPTGVGPAMEFARWWLTRARPNRRVLLIPAGYGGTQLVTGVALGWRVGVAGGLNANAKTQVDAALAAAGPGARLRGIFWLQGESDGDALKTGPQYQADFDALIDFWQAAFPGVPFIVGQMVPEYIPTEGTRAAINAVHADTPNRKSNTAFVPSPTGANLGDQNHFNAKGARIIGRRWFEALLALLAPVVPPAQVTGLASTAQTMSTVTLAWPAVARATTYLVEYRVDGTAPWTAGPTVTTPNATVSGLNEATPYKFRVTASNSGGSAVPSSVVDQATLADTTAVPIASTGWAQMYGLRKLQSGYTGQCVRVRRSSDNTEQDIGFFGNKLNTAALLSFVGSGDAFVTTWYDQSGNARHVTQATPAAQPKLVIGGVLNVVNGRPAITADGVDDCLFNTTPAGLYAGAASVLGVVKAVTPSAQKRWWSESVSTQAQTQFGLMQPDYQPKLNVGRGIGSGIPTATSNDPNDPYAGVRPVFDGALHQASATASLTHLGQWVDGQLDLDLAYTRTSGGTARDRFTLFGVTRSGSLAALAGTIGEFLSRTEVLSDTDRQAVEANQKAYFGTP